MESVGRSEATEKPTRGLALKDRYDFRMRPLARQVQCGAPVRISQVDVGACLDQRSGCFDVSSGRRTHEGRAPLVAAQLDVGALGQKDSDHLSVVSLSGNDQSRIAACVAGVEIGTVALQ